MTVFDHPGNTPTDSYREWLDDPSRRGEPPIDSFSGAAGGSACGDVVRLSLVPDGEYRISAVSWDAEGCSAMLASAAALAEILEGKRLIHCHSYRQDEIVLLCRIAKDFGWGSGYIDGFVTNTFRNAVLTTLR